MVSDFKLVKIARFYSKFKLWIPLRSFLLGGCNLPKILKGKYDRMFKFASASFAGGETSP